MNLDFVWEKMTVTSWYKEWGLWLDLLVTLVGRYLERRAAATIMDYPETHVSRVGNEARGRAQLFYA